MLVRSWPVGAGIPDPGQGDEAGLVVRVVLHVLHQDVQPVERGGQAGGDGRGGPGETAGSPAPTSRAASAVELVATSSTAGSCLVEEAAALGGGHGDGRHPLDVGEARSRAGHQVEVDVQDHLPLDAEVEVEDQAVDDVPDRALDGVLQGDEAEVDPALAAPTRAPRPATRRG